MIEPSTGLWIAAIGIIIPLVLSVGGWLMYFGAMKQRLDNLTALLSAQNVEERSARNDLIGQVRQMQGEMAKVGQRLANMEGRLNREREYPADPS